VGNTPGTFKIGTCSKDIVVSSGTETFRSKLTLVEKETSQVRAKFAGDRGNLASSPGISAAAKVPSPPPAVSETEGSPGQGWRIAGLATAGAGVVGVGLGVYYGIKAKSLADELTSSSTFDASKDDARKGAINLQYVGYVAGGAALLGGVAMYYLLGDSGSRVAVAPQLTPHYAGISVRVGTR
jgi:serine/threonine-protein kinase